MDDTQLEFANKAKRMGKEGCDQIQNLKKNSEVIGAFYDCVQKVN